MEPERNTTTQVNSYDHNVTANKISYQTVSKNYSHSVMSILHSATELIGIEVPGRTTLIFAAENHHW